MHKEWLQELFAELEFLKYHGGHNDYEEIERRLAPIVKFSRTKALKLLQERRIAPSLNFMMRDTTSREEVPVISSINASMKREAEKRKKM